MGALPAQSDEPSLSAVQTLMNCQEIPDGTEQHLHHLALQVAHCLRFQHEWTDIRIHRASSNTLKLPRPMISGLPPRRLYVHPDEQIELLQKQKNAGKPGLPDLPREREWVLPCHLRERWTLRKFGEVFDGIDVVPPTEGGDSVFERHQRSDEHDTIVVAASTPNKWRLEKPKRLLLATLDDDSTIVFYIVHDGVVKPRQN